VPSNENEQEDFMRTTVRKVVQRRRPRGNRPNATLGPKALLVLLSLTMATMVCACGGGGTPTKLDSVSVAPQTVAVEQGASQQFKATGTYSDGSSQNLTASVTWGSSNPAVATINASGLATTVGTGSVTISASMSSVTGTASLAVNPAVSVSVSPSSASIAVGQTQQFTASVTNTTNSAVTWSVDGVAGGGATAGTVSSSGLYQAPPTSGTHQVSATSQADPAKSAQAGVTVAYQGMLTYHNDNGRTGQNLSEVTLTPVNVNSTQFGKLISYPVDGAIYAQPIYVASVTVPSQGVHNVVYVVTQHDSVYAFDADGTTPDALWHVSFINPSAGVTSVSQADVHEGAFPAGEIGITSTPVIDPVGGTLYVVAYTDENGNFVYRLHALDLATGAEKFGGPATIQSSVPGTGDDSNGQGQVLFIAADNLQRPGLLLLNGVVYIAFAGHSDTRPWHGWLLAYNATTLKPAASFNTTPNGYGASVWESGCAPAADADGNIYVSTGNGTFDADFGGADYGDSILKLESGVLMQSGALTLLDWFSPFNSQHLSEVDSDLGSGGTMLLPDQPGPHSHLLAIAGKEDVGSGKGRIYLVDRDNLGHFNSGSNDQIVQEVLGAINDNDLSTPGYWQGNLYYASDYDNLKMFTLQNGLLSTSPVAASPETLGYRGASPSISSNGSTGGIVWVIDTSAAHGAVTGGPAVLRAYDATNVFQELYNSSQGGARDTLGPAVKFTIPTVINGKVYVGTASELDVLGPLSQ
jgi:Bacterial Ig-like domain (group 2)